MPARATERAEPAPTLRRSGRVRSSTRAAPCWSSSCCSSGSASPPRSEPATSGDAADAATGAAVVPVARADAVCPDPAVDATTETRSVWPPPAPSRPTAGGGPTRPAPASARCRPPVRRAARRGVLDRCTLADVRLRAGPADPGRTDGRWWRRGRRRSAPGMAAAMLTRSTRDDMRGLAGTACAAPGTDFWFVGSGAVVGQRGRVYLTNPEPAPAVVDVTLYGPDGADRRPAGAASRSPPARRRCCARRAGAGHQPVRRPRARAQRPGRRRRSATSRSQGLTPRGADWLPAPPHRPAGRCCPACCPAPGERRLQVVAPGDSDAIVKVRLITSRGSFAPVRPRRRRGAAGTVTDVDLAPFAGGEAVAVELDVRRSRSPPGC